MSAELEVTLSDVVDAAMLRMAVETRTAVPCNVIAYRGPGIVGPEFVKVELGLKATLRDGRNLTLPEVDRVPILWPGGNGFHCGIELAKGDGLLCVVSDRAIDSWLQAGGVQVPTNGRLHDITDIVALPGLRSVKHAITVQRGAGTWYIGTDSGAAPWIRLKKTPATATIDAPAIHLGDAAALGVARLTDPAGINAFMFGWMNAVAGFINAIAPGTIPVVVLGQSIADISQASTQVFSK